MVPTDAHIYLDDHDKSRPQIGQRFIDHVREIGPPIICTHKGISSIVGSTPELAEPERHRAGGEAQPRRQLRRVPLRVRAGQGGVGPYDPNDPAPQGVDRLIRSVRGRGHRAERNVYAELGGTWWFLMRNPTQAAHVLGKLLKYIGDERVLWGTDSIWFGTPQDQIQAMRTFQIAEQLQEAHGYPELTPTIKAGIFGLNAAALYGIEPIAGPLRAEPEGRRADPGDAAPGDHVRARDRRRRRADDRRAPSRVHAVGSTFRSMAIEIVLLGTGNPLPDHDRRAPRHSCAPVGRLCSSMPATRYACGWRRPEFCRSCSTPCC